MGYRFNRQPPLAFVATLALGSRPKQGFARLRPKKEVGNHTTYSRECEKVCSQRAKLRRIMPTTFENLVIAQHMDTLQYAIIRGGGYRPSIHRGWHMVCMTPLMDVVPTRR
ncbi:unnamed protein product [Sphagnum balticum]